VADKFAEFGRGEELRRGLTAAEEDARAGAACGGEAADRVGSIGLTAPFDGGSLGLSGASDDNDFISDHEAGKEADAELSDEVVAGSAEIIAFGAFADGGEEAVDFFFGEADAVVFDHEGRGEIAILDE